MSSGVRGPGSVQGSDETSDIFSPKKNQTNNTGSPPIKNNDSSKPENVFQSHQNHFSDFPEILSSSWEEGFIWKGVYLKLYSKNDAQSLKKELKVLKHLGIEYLQTETSMRITDNMHSISLNPNESLEGLRANNGPILSVILPLICTVEGSSWVLLGTPIFPIKTKPAEDYMLRLSHEVNNMFRNTFLLSNMNIKNFKVYNKLEDGQQKVAHHSSSQNNNSFLLLSNVGKSIASLPKENILMVINQDPNVPISFLEYPHRGFDVNLIKKALGLGDEDIGTDNLLPGKRAPKIVHDFSFDTLLFKRRGWHLQIVHVVGSHRPLPSNMVINKRAMSFLSNSNKKR